VNHQVFLSLNRASFCGALANSDTAETSFDSAACLKCRTITTLLDVKPFAKSNPAHADGGGKHQSWLWTEAPFKAQFMQTFANRFTLTNHPRFGLS